MLARLTTWDVGALEHVMRADVLSWGPYNFAKDRVTLGKDHRDYDHLFECDQEVWAVVEISEKDNRSEIRLHVYATINVTQERWCILTSSSHTLLHLL